MVAAKHTSADSHQSSREPPLVVRDLRLPLGGAGPSPKGSHRAMLHVPQLTLQAGTLTAIVGVNGSGKTTLLRAMAGLLVPSAGSVRCAGADVATMKHQQRARRIAYVSQRGEVSEAFVSREVVALGLHALGISEQGAQQRALAALARVDAAHLAEQAFDTLSGGEKQRVQLARALAQLSAHDEHDASTAHRARSQSLDGVLLADEPTSAMDPRHTLHALTVLRAASAQGLTVAIAMHDIALALRMCDKVVLLGRDADAQPAHASQHNQHALHTRDARVLFAGEAAALANNTLQAAMGVAFADCKVTGGMHDGLLVRAGFTAPAKHTP